MKLYSYDHCPYCVRARMIFGLHRLAFAHEILLNDDEATPIGLVGKKLVPILIKDDGIAMGESLDIVHYVDQLQPHPLLRAQVRTAIRDWIAAVSAYSNCLVMPRVVAIGLPEFATESSRRYYTDKKSAAIGDFAEHLRQTPQYLQKIDADLQALAPLLISPQGACGEISEEDILLFPLLRSLSVVKDVRWPSAVIAYLRTMSEQSGVALYSDRAC